MPHRFRELVVWQRAMELVTQIYVLTRDFPQHELFGLTNQLRRAAVSIPLNIAEGAGSDSPNEFRRFLDIALKSTYETMTAIEIGKRLQYCGDERAKQLLDESDQIAAMIVGLAKNLRTRPDFKQSREANEEYDSEDDYVSADA